MPIVPLCASTSARAIARPRPEPLDRARPRAARTPRRPCPGLHRDARAVVDHFDPAAAGRVEDRPTTATSRPSGATRSVFSMRMTSTKLDHLGVDRDDDGVVGHGEAHSVAGREVPQTTDRAACDLADVGRLESGFDRPGMDAAELQDLRDQPFEPLGLLVRGRRAAGRARVVDRGRRVLERLDRGLDRREWRAQVVGHRGEERGAALVDRRVETGVERGPLVLLGLSANALTRATVNPDATAASANTMSVTRSSWDSNVNDSVCGRNQ